MTRDTRTPEEAPLDLDGLTELARAATPGPWRASGPTIWKPLNPDDATDFSGEAIAYVPTLNDEFNHLDAAFIAAANPSTVLRLIDLARLGAAAGEAVRLMAEGLQRITDGSPLDDGTDLREWTEWAQTDAYSVLREPAVIQALAAKLREADR